MKPKPGNQSANMTSASFTLVGFGMQPDEVTKTLGIKPTEAGVGPMERCGTGRKDECGIWSCDTAHLMSVQENDIEAHLEYLLNLLRPLKSRIEEIRPKPNASIHLIFNPKSVVPLLPQIAAKHIAGIAELGASLTLVLLGDWRASPLVIPGCGEG